MNLPAKLHSALEEARRRDASDIFLYQTITRTRLPDARSSSGGRGGGGFHSSSGGSYGGTGGKL